MKTFLAILIVLAALLLLALIDRHDPGRHIHVQTVPRPPAVDGGHLPDVAAATSTTAPPTTTTTAPPAPTTTRASRNAPGRPLGSFVATCYSLTGRTATGSPAGPGSIAVDPTVIPLGTRLNVSGYGTGRAVDTGRLIKGRRIDVWKAAGCSDWGRRTVTVSIAR